MIFPKAAASRLYTARSGAVFPIFAVCITALILAVGLAVDVGRVYAVRVKAQQASDAAMLGAVATASQSPVNAEYIALFNSNFPPGYMGSTLVAIGGSCANANASLCTGKVTLTVPMTLMVLANANSRQLNVTTQVSRGFANQPQKLELTLVADNSNRMGIGGVNALRNAADNMVNLIFGGVAVLPNVAVSLVPYANYVNLRAANRLTWIQPAYQPGYNGLAENRNSDNPRNAYDDGTDTPPTVLAGPGASNQFRTPLNRLLDMVPAGPQIAQLQFAQTTLASVRNSINNMTVASSRTRTNVGLLWGRMTLSPAWQSVWDITRPTLPWSLNAQLSRAIVLVSGSRDNVFTGNNIAITNDDAEMLRQCVAAETNGIEVFIVAYGGGADQTMLANCAADQAHFFVAPNQQSLNTALASIADTLLFNTIRLSQ